MRTLKDIKRALERIPEDILDRLRFGLGDGSEEVISVVIEFGDDEDKDLEVFEKYPELSELSNLIKNIIKAQDLIERQNEEAEEISNKLFEDGIDSKFFNENGKRRK